MTLGRCINRSECSQCGLCCTSISGMKYIPKMVDISFLESHHPEDKEAYRLVTDCPYLLTNGTCGVFDVRQKYPEYFRVCNDFTGTRNIFSHKLSYAILNPSKTEAELILKAANSGYLEDMKSILSEHYKKDLLWGFIRNCENLIDTLKSYGWSDENIYDYFYKTHILSFLHSQIKMVRIIFLIRKSTKRYS